MALEVTIHTAWAAWDARDAWAAWAAWDAANSESAAKKAGAFFPALSECVIGVVKALPVREAA